MKIFSFLLLALFVAFTSCEKDNEEGIKTEQIEEVNAIMMHWQDSTSLDLVLRTLETHECGSAYMVSESNHTNNSFSIHLKEIKVPEVCIDTTGWPREIIEFPQLPNGEYPVSIKVGSKARNNGKLIVSERKYELKMETNHGLNYPKGTVFEY